NERMAGGEKARESGRAVMVSVGSFSIRGRSKFEKITSGIHRGGSEDDPIPGWEQIIRVDSGQHQPSAIGHEQATSSGDIGANISHGIFWRRQKLRRSDPDCELDKAAGYSWQVIDGEGRRYRVRSDGRNAAGKKLRTYA